MVRTSTLVARIGAGACLLLVVLVAVPYAVADATEVAVYYGVVPVGPPLVAAAAGVTLVVFLGGASGRTDPATAAGVALVFGVVVAAASLWWVGRAGAVAGGMVSVGATFDYHRYAVAGAGLVVAGAAMANARAVL